MKRAHSIPCRGLVWRLLRAAAGSGVMAAALMTASAADWPQWRGPEGNGISTEKGWLATWPDEGPPAIWKAAVGIGFSGLSISQGRLYTMGGASNNMDTVYCLDADKGTVLWHYSYPSLLDPNQ